MELIMLRFGLFLLTNLAVIIVASIWSRQLGVANILAGNDLNLNLGELKYGD